MRRSGQLRAVVVAAVSALSVTACGSRGEPMTDGGEPDTGVLVDLLRSQSAGRERTVGDDAFEVWVCHIPLDTTDPIYGGLPLRLPLTPAGVADVVDAHVTPYFEQLSHGRYRPVFTAGGEVTVAAADGPAACVDAAIAAAADTAAAVLVVADAEHVETQPGGLGNGGNPCPPGDGCPVAISRRSAYVGAADFHPDWGDAPPMDLVQHEIGHTLGWVHSGVDAAGRYLSGLDVMSNSAAPREVDDSRRDAPGTLALNLLLAGWLPTDDVRVVTGSAEVSLTPSADDAGTRLIVLDRGGGQFHTIELLADSGRNDHLPATGVAVHSVTLVAGSITAVEPEVGEAPFTDLLQQGAQFDVDGWQITIGDGWTVRIVDPAPLDG